MIKDSPEVLKKYLDDFNTVTYEFMLNNLTYSSNKINTTEYYSDVNTFLTVYLTYPNKLDYRSLTNSELVKLMKRFKIVGFIYKIIKTKLLITTILINNNTDIYGVSGELFEMMNQLDTISTKFYNSTINELQYLDNNGLFESKFNNINSIKAIILTV